jgi:predicted metalloprotease with PDZ domain
MISYRIDIHNPNAHLFRVTLTIPEPAALQRLSLPVWIPGSYLVREFARHLSALEATQGSRAIALQQLDKATWQAACSGRGALVVRYLVYAFDTSVRAAFLDAQRGFFNGTSTCLRVEGREAEPHCIELRSLPRGWRIATAMRPRSKAVFDAADYDELVDHPFELGRFWRGEFTACGVPHELVVAGALPDFDSARLQADTQRICETAIALWHGAPGVKPRRRDVPFARYVFLLNAVDDGYGGLEHRASTALIAARRDLPPRVAAAARPAELTDGYVTLMGLISHEYFHTWNVKRLKPRDFAPYDYARENYTELLWFFEGFTSYYDDLLLLRAGLIDQARYLRLLGKNIDAVAGTPGRQVQSVAAASFDAWVKYYRADENTPNATVSYYTAGALVALALDLSLRAGSADHIDSKQRRQQQPAQVAQPAATLDVVMRALWTHSAASAHAGICEADIVAAVRDAMFAACGAKRADALAQQLSQWVHGTGELPLAALLQRAGVRLVGNPQSLAQRLGLRVTESALAGIKVTHVLRGGVAERAGLSAGDELIALGDWRLRRLDDALRLLPTDAADAAAATLLVSRDQRLLRLVIDMPAAPLPDALAVSAGAGAGAAKGAMAGAARLTAGLAADAQADASAVALRTAWING